MLNTRTIIIIVGLLGSLAQGDSPAPPVPFVFTSEYPGEELSDAEVEELRPRLDYENKFTLNTIDGQKYVFDATTGKITSNTK